MNILPRLEGKRRSRERTFDTSGAPFQNLVGKKFGKLAVTSWAGKSEVGKTKPRKSDFWLCACDCGASIKVVGASLATGNTTSCGCKNYRHGMSKSSLYSVWGNMIRRCSDPSNLAYKNYGGRGIKVCDRWLESFNNFLADMGLPPSDDHSIERIDNNGDYCPANCRWANTIEQARNKRTSRYITWQGETKTSADWGEDPRLVKLGITSDLIRSRIDSDWDLDEAMTSPAVNGKVITYDGEALTMVEWSRRLGSSVNVVSKRIRKGWDIEDAIAIPLGATRKLAAKIANQRCQKLITYKDETLSMIEWSRRLGAAKNIVSARISAGWSPEKAVSTPLMKRYKRLHANPTDSSSNYLGL